MVISILIFLWCSSFCAVTVCEPEECWVGREETGLEGVGASIEDFVYGIYYIVNQRL
jgi:hypothetical protein